MKQPVNRWMIGMRPGLDNRMYKMPVYWVLLGVEVTAEQVCLCMVALKMSRQCHKPKRDNLVDGCGYLRNVEMIEEEEEYKLLNEVFGERACSSEDRD